ncbi:unnamed protein product [Mytilus coruscus]|uniref:Uncharacterized protein n=1 Tax=Mytilus coruscus TaxID=42192 RepID=A0A6J8AF78_MYTCO|nr:unnamed protein product [Mytilus coruscus]
MKRLEEHIVDLQCRSIKNNLIFPGIDFQREEQVEEKLKSFLYYELKIDQKIEFGNCHRFGKLGLNGIRLIVARFIYRKDLETVLNRTYHLRGKPFGIKEQFSGEVEARRKKLYPVMKKARQDGKRVNLARDQLYIDGKEFIAEPENSSLNSDSINKHIQQSPPIPPRPGKRASRDSYE